jgi:hypothetical protein
VTKQIPMTEQMPMAEQIPMTGYIPMAKLFLLLTPHSLVRLAASQTCTEST